MSNVFSCGGYLGGDASFVTTKNGKKMLTFSVANKIGYGRDETTQWIRCRKVVSENSSMDRYLKKGQYVFVSGELTLNMFKNRNNEQQASLDLYASVLEMGGRSSVGSNDSKYDDPVYPSPGDDFDDDLDDDIPF